MTKSEAPEAMPKRFWAQRSIRLKSYYGSYVARISNSSAGKLAERQPSFHVGKKPFSPPVRKDSRNVRRRMRPKSNASMKKSASKLWKSSSSEKRLHEWSKVALWRSGGRGNEPVHLVLRRKKVRDWCGVCTIWDIPRSTYYRHKSFSVDIPGRRGPIGLHTDEELVENIRQVLAKSPFTGEGYRKAWARLRAKSIRTSPKRVLRLMRANGLLAKKAGWKTSWSQRYTTER